MSSDFATVLDECLDRLKAGDSIVACLESYPEHAEELQPLLEISQFAEALRFTEPPRPQALARGRQRFLTEAVHLREQQASNRPLLDQVRDFFAGGVARPLWSRAAAAIVVVLLLFGAVSGVVVQASASSLPGDPLYSVKQVTRQVQLLTILDPKEREEKREQIQAEEREEVQQATEQGRVFEKDVAGVIIGWQSDSLVLEGNLRIRLTDMTEILGQPGVNRIATIHIRSENGQLLAEKIVAHQLVVLVSATETATLMPTATPVPTETPRPTNTREPTKPPTRQVTSTSTPTPKPKVTETPIPTITEKPGEVTQIFEISGAIEFISESIWVVGGQEIQVTPGTIIKGELPAVGRFARVRANRLADSTLVAVEIDIETVSTPTPEKVVITGVVDSKESEWVWYVNGQRIRGDDRTEIKGELRLGAFVRVEGRRESQTTVFAEKITVERACETPGLIQGVIRSMDADAGIWMVDGLTIRVSSSTEIQGPPPVVGAVVQIEACRIEDEDGVYEAQRVFVMPTPTPTNTPTPTSTPIFTSTPEPPSLQSTPTVSSEPTLTPSPEGRDVSTPTPEPISSITSTPPNEVSPTATP